MTDNQTFYQNLTVERSTDSSLLEDKVKSRDTRIVPGKFSQYPLIMSTCVKNMLSTILIEEPGFKNVKNKHLGMSPF